MPNTAVRAAAEGLPAMSRREALASLGVATFASVAVCGSTAAVEPSSALPLAEMMEDLEWRKQEWLHADEACNAALRAAWDMAPPAKVLQGRLFKQHDENGNPVFEPVWAYSEAEIEKARVRFLSSAFLRREERDLMNGRFDEMLEELRRCMVERELAEQVVGLKDLDREQERAFDAYLAAQRAVFAYTPKDAAERSAKASYLVRLLLDNTGFSDGELALIFGATEAEIAEVEDNERQRDARDLASWAA